MNFAAPPIKLDKKLSKSIKKSSLINEEYNSSLAALTRFWAASQDSA
jgi:hypothetical protein